MELGSYEGEEEGSLQNQSPGYPLEDTLCTKKVTVGIKLKRCFTFSSGSLFSQSSKRKIVLLMLVRHSRGTGHK